MSVDTIDSPMIVIDTESYSGNFEHEMAVYLTGQFGSSRVGEKNRDLYAGEITHLAWWDDHTVKLEDEHTYLTPVTIYPTHGWFNNGMGGYFRDLPENYEIAELAALEARREYQAPHIKAAQDRLDAGNFEDDKPGAWTKQACEDAIKRAHEFIENAGTYRFPAHMSVAIFVDEMPPREVLEELFERARQFGETIHPQRLAPYTTDPIKVTGFRFVDVLTVEHILDTETASPNP